MARDWRALARAFALDLLVTVLRWAVERFLLRPAAPPCC